MRKKKNTNDAPNLRITTSRASVGFICQCLLAKVFTRTLATLDNWKAHGAIPIGGVFF